MRDDERFEIGRAFDLLPHVAGASWAAVWFRMNGKSNPTREEYRQAVVRYFGLLDPLFESYPRDGAFEDIRGYIRRRREEETDMILRGLNGEVEKRYDRYVDYG